MDRACETNGGTGATPPNLPNSVSRALSKLKEGSEEELSQPTTTRDDKEWFTIGDRLVRVHRRARKTIFTPGGTKCPISTDFLDDEMVTIAWERKSGENTTQKEAWRKRVANHSGERWVGYSVFG